MSLVSNNPQQEETGETLIEKAALAVRDNSKRRPLSNPERP